MGDRGGWVQGLSPRVRGNPVGVADCYVHRRSIPARAGEPKWAESVAWSWRVYPRACGGTLKNAARIDVGHGLSPRVRGNPTIPDADGDEWGSIPARAGEPRLR